LKIDGNFLVIQKESVHELINALKNMSVCPNCLSEVGMDAKFCTHCGASLQEERQELELLL
jgi:rRNA maturation endonuclease Nob1